MDGIIMTMIGNVCERARSQKPDEHLAQAQAHERRFATFVTRIWPGSRQRLQAKWRMNTIGSSQGSRRTWVQAAELICKIISVYPLCQSFQMESKTKEK